MLGQLAESLRVRDIAETITRCSPEEATVENLPRRGAGPEHYGNVEHTRLVEPGLTPHLFSGTPGSRSGARTSQRPERDVLRATA